jgi:hypothetical protein
VRAAEFMEELYRKARQDGKRGFGALGNEPSA